jgi:iron complex transport system ATP-binding protein
MILVAKKCTVSGENGQFRLDRIDVEVGRGEMHAVIGPNGAGKSTLMGILSGIITPDSGTVEFMDAPLGDLSVLGQELAVSFGFTVSEVVAWGRAPWRGTKEASSDQEKIDLAIQVAEIAPLCGRRINQLSGGERKRVHIARVIAQDCPLMFFDEPDSDLDLVGTRQLEETLRTLHQGGRTLVVSSHNLSWISGLSTHVILMGEHEVLAAGPVREVFTSELLSRAYRTKISVAWSTDARGHDFAICTSS